LIESQKTKILYDPWFTGSAFNNGWRLLYEDSHCLRDLAYDYIWISHEHPDHFFIPTLKQLQSKTHFIYQLTRDKRVVTWLSKNHLGWHNLISLKRISVLQSIFKFYPAALNDFEDLYARLCESVSMV